MLLCNMCVNTSPTRCVVVNSDETFLMHLLQSRQADNMQKTCAEDKLYTWNLCSYSNKCTHFGDKILSRGLSPFKSDLNLQNFYSCMCYRKNNTVIILALKAI